MILKYHLCMHISRKLFPNLNYRLKSSATLLRSQCPLISNSETDAMNLHIIGNTFVTIRINSLALHFIIPIGFRLFAIAEFILIVNNRKIFGQVVPGLNSPKYLTLYRLTTLMVEHPSSEWVAYRLRLFSRWYRVRYFGLGL